MQSRDTHPHIHAHTNAKERTNKLPHHTRLLVIKQYRNSFQKRGQTQSGSGSGSVTLAASSSLHLHLHLPSVIVMAIALVQVIRYYRTKLAAAAEMPRQYVETALGESESTRP